MNSQKKRLLEKAYRQFFVAGTQSISDAPLHEYVEGKVIGIGTAVDEKIRGIGELRKLLKNQQKQMKGLKVSWKRVPISSFITPDENTAVYADDVYLSINSGKERLKMYIRLSVVLQYGTKGWKVIHWHGSKPEEVRSEEDSFGVEQWKQKTAALQKLVDEKTADLLQKNRELEIEASLEKVRAVAMGMKEREDMLKICTMIAKQLAVLGLKEIRNVQTAIFNVPMGTYMNYEFYAKHDKTFITETAYTNHKVALAFAKTMLKGKGAVAIKHFKDKEKVMDWLRYQKGTNVFIDTYLKTATSLSYYWYSLGPVALGISTYQQLTKEELQLFERFLKVFELAYKRYLDIEKAEAQTREAQIEAALERIRAKSMAMQDSSEIGKLILHVYTELTRLDARLDRCFFMIVNPENLGITWWMASQEGLLAENGFFVQYNEHPSHLLYLDHWKNCRKKWHYLFAGKEKRDWDRFGFTQTALSRLPESVKKFMSAAKSVHLSGSSDAFGSLVTGSFEPLSEEHQDIISRFASVFNQTYTRFNDLKKAEAQARESQIEAALERIRSRTVGMQKSEELKEVIQVVYEQFIRLGIHTEHAGFIIDYRERNDYNTWIADQFGSPSQVVIPYFDCIYYNRFNAAKDRGEEFFTLTLTRQEKDRFYKGLFKRISDFPEASKQIIFRHPGFTISTVLLENVALYIENFTGLPYAEEDNAILIRFGKVFQQTYTRFLDLQKAEEQAKESQIQLALERVRARTMAMQQSTELPEAANLLFLQLQALGMPAWSAGYCIWEDDKKAVTLWMSSEGVIQPPFKAPTTEDELFIQMRKGHEKGKDLHVVEMGGEKLEAHYQYMRTLPVVGEVLDAIIKAGHPLPVYQVMHYAYFSKGYLLFITYEPVPAAHEIFKRFANVFDQTYTRFLDLQKSEEQAREAKIEAALEKVRSRSLAMQQPEELVDVAKVLREEMGYLGVEELETSSIYIVDRESRQAECWYAIKDIREESTQLVSDQMILALHETGVGKEMWKFFVSNKEWTSIVMKGESRKEWINYCAGRSQVLEGYYGHEIPERTYHLVKFTGGYMGAASPGDISPESWDLLKKVSTVFSFAYTRFKDLQDARARAREAQIELALERVRARTMAMHHSDELAEVVSMLHRQFEELGFGLYQILISIFDTSKNQIEWWSRGFGEKDLPQCNIIPLIPHPLPEMQMQKWKSGASSHAYVFGGEEKRSWEKYLFSATDLRHFPEEVKQAMQSIEEVYLTDAFMKYGVLQAAGPEPLPQEKTEILVRFANVLDQAYTRMMDLQKAESQAREAKIEAALERVRSRSMAMHKSEELSDLSLELVKQVQALGVATWFCAFNIYDEENNNSVEWGSNGEGVFSKYRTPREGIFLRYYEAGQRGDTLLVNEIGEDECPAHYEYLCSLPGVGDQLLQMKAAGLPFPVSQIDHVAFFRHGYIIFITYERVPEAHDIFKRFARIFEQSYTRFLDLQKAEAQARKAQIEVAVERVRAKALAMHKSEEILQVAVTLKEQMEGLDLQGVTAATIYLQQDDGLIRAWDITELKESENGPQLTVDFAFDLEATDPGLWIRRIWGAKEKYSVVEMSGNDFAICEKWLRSFDGTMADNYLKFIEAADLKHSWHPTVSLENGKLNIDFILPPPAEMEFILPKMGAAFDLAYRRFRDLQKAEEQTRESQVQLALERVRARTMAMHKSDELPETSHILFEQMKELGEPVEQLTIGIINEENRVVEISATLLGDTLQKIYNHSVDEPYMMAKVYKAWKEQQKTLVVELRGDELNAYNQYRNELTNSKMFLTNHEKEDQRIVYAAFFSNGMLALGSNEKRPPALLQLLVKFASVFDLTYRRFLDLQRAEAQAREAQIEAALERVRSRSMAMHKSAELLEAGEILFAEMNRLGIESLTAGYVLLDKDGVNGLNYTPDPFTKKVLPLPVIIPHNETVHMRQVVENWKKGNLFYTVELDEAETIRHQTFIAERSTNFTLNAEQLIAISPSRLFLHNFYFKEGYILIVGGVKLSAEQNDIMLRFAKVFQQTYTRFLDLQKAEAQTKEAQIEAALEKVRSRTLAMQKSDELAETAAVLFQQLIALGIEPNRLYIILIRENDAEMEAWVTDEDGSKVSMGFTGNYKKNESLFKMYEGWREKRSSLIIDMQGEELQQYFHYLHDELKVPFKGGLEQKRRVQHITYFSHGLIGMASPEEQPAETLQLMERFAAVFNLTFTRFNDLKIAEAHAAQAELDLIAIKEAKQKAEEALTELQSTQKQLIQSEKMASLGELTAGIAHEIQNPLNFVNNFSEVSRELLDEIKEELEKGNLEDAKELMQDVIQNLEKINHHGKRADGIVKGMLQHSRSGSGQMEPTDINALCDEYLRLAFHGLRAKDKSFNAKFETSFDGQIGKINVLPQDLGRVILNLINNAFYAVSERKKKGEAGYEPRVTVTTKKSAQVAEIIVKDNGTGIPKHIVDKIFQPFFTTKPTGQGTGLGLSLSYDIVKSHEGELKVETKEGVGTEFIIILPVNVSR